MGYKSKQDVVDSVKVDNVWIISSNKKCMMLIGYLEKARILIG